MSQPGDSMFGVTPAGGARIDLDTDTIETIDVLNAGIPNPLHQAVRTPGRDGETIVRTVLEPRFLITRHEISGLNAAHVRHLRQVLIELANPKMGKVTIDFSPPGTGTTYLIDGHYAGGLEFERSSPTQGEFNEATIDISWRCPDPAWRWPQLSQWAVATAGVGLMIPLVIPWAIADGGQQAVVTNAGSMEAYPVIRVEGVCEGVRIDNLTTGQYVWFPGLALSTGERLTIDMDRRTARVGAVNVMPYRVGASWALRRGDNLIAVSTQSGSAEVVLRFPIRLLGV